MDLKKFEQLKKQYEEFIAKAEKDIEGEKAIQQTRSVWFDRHTIEKLLAQTDPETGGLKIFIGRYDGETLPEQEGLPTNNELIGQLTLILTASNDNQDPETEAMVINAGKICPPDC